MILEQRFMKEDLEEVGQVFSKSMEPKCPILKSGSKLNKMWKSLLIIFSLILFGCSAVLTALKGEFSTELILYVLVGVIGFLTVIIWNGLEKKMKPADVVKRKYGEPFVIAIKEDTLVYKQMDFSYVDIRVVVEYKNFLFIKVDGKWLIIKADEEEKEVILSKMNEKITIHFMQEKEPFDLRKLR